MKKGIHPRYDFVIMRDSIAEYSFLTRSTMTSAKKITWKDGKEYPVIDVEISSASHPFYTGKQKLLDVAGRIEKFRRKYSSVEK